jgi:hypothetical protein
MSAFKVISETEFNTYQKAWLNAIPTNLVTPFDAKYFKTNVNWIYGYEIDASLIKILKGDASQNVVFSFIIHDNMVKIVVHGANVLSNRAITPYYMLETPIIQPFIFGFIPKSKIPKEFAEKWIGAWNYRLASNQIESSIFLVSDIPDLDEAKLRTYNFPKGEVTHDKKVIIYFAIHHYTNPKVTNPKGGNLFSLIIEWEDAILGIDEAYFNLSQPCPPICPPFS